MNLETKQLHEKFKQLGDKLGFIVEGEVSDSILRYRINEGYRPRIDIIWSLKLSRFQQKAIAWALGAEKLDTLLLPIVGIEIERSSPTTKTRQADLANLLSIGMPFGIIATAENNEKGGYRRTARVIFSMKSVFGTINAIPFEEKWMERFLKQKWPSGKCEIDDIRSKGPGGGEKGWGKSVRKSLRRKGEESGFIVVESFTPPILQSRYNLALELSSKPFKYTWDPINFETRKATSAKNYLTGCEIDLVWIIPLPKALKSFLNEIDKLDPFLRQQGLLFSNLWNTIPVVAFEIESYPGKHAAGGLLNIAAYSILGVVLTNTESSAGKLRATLETYRPTLGLRNLYVKAMPPI
jgi:hypothetical protein